jgi:tRNA-binding protein
LLPFAYRDIKRRTETVDRADRAVSCARRGAGAGADRGFVSHSYPMDAGAATLSYAEFDRVDVRVGRIVEVQDFPEARKPAYKLKIDFGGALGIRKSSAQATVHYGKADLVGRLVVAVVNFPPKQIGPFMSEVLTLGVPHGSGGVVLLTPEREVPLGGRMF